MIDLNIRRGLSSVLFSEPGVINPRLIIEEGCWYLSTDTAELFLGVQTADGLTLKRINGGTDTTDRPTQTPSTGEMPARVIIDAFIDEDTGMLHLVFSDDTEDMLGPVIGKDGLVTSIRIGDTVYEHKEGCIELPNFITTDDLSDYVKKTELPSIEDLATETFVKDEIAKIEIADIPTKVSELENDAGYITVSDIPEINLSDYYNKSETEALVSEALGGITIPDTSEFITIEDVEAKGYLTEHQDLSDYAKKTDIPSPELFIIDFNAPDYTKAVEAYNSGKVLLLSNAAPDINSYAMMNYVSSNYITFTKFLMSRSATYGAFNTYYLKSDNTWEVAKEVKLNKVEATRDTDGVTTLTIGKDNYKLDYVTNNYIVENYTTTEQLQATYITNDKVTEIITEEVTNKVDEQVEAKVTEVIQEKVTTGEIAVTASAISYGDF